MLNKEVRDNPVLKQLLVDAAAAIKPRDALELFRKALTYRAYVYKRPTHFNEYTGIPDAFEYEDATDRDKWGGKIPRECPLAQWLKDILPEGEVALIDGLLVEHIKGYWQHSMGMNYQDDGYPVQAYFRVREPILIKLIEGETDI